MEKNTNLFGVEKFLVNRILHRTLKLIIIFLSAFSVMESYSKNNTINSGFQQSTISGKVTYSSGGGFFGVSVVLKGTNNGTITNEEGNYSLANVTSESILVFSYLGMQSQEIAVGNQTEINVKMLEDQFGLDEIVVVGYGAQKKSDLTGSISRVDMEQIKNIPALTIDQKMIGQSAGVQISQTSGIPGGGTSIRIRGVGSLGAGNEPLYVVDGIPLSQDAGLRTNPLLNINPLDIKSIDILKDASSTAIYGSRGANGVILITTKKGSVGKTEVNFSVMTGVQTVPEKGRLKMMNAPEFADFQRELIGLRIRQQENREPTINDYPVEYLPENIKGEGTNWVDLYYRSAITQDYNFSIQKGSEKSLTQFSLGYSNQEGVIKTTGLERYTAKLSMEYKLSDAIKVGGTLQPSYTKQILTDTNGTAQDETLYSTAVWANPVMSPYDENGKLIPFIYSPSNKYVSAYSFANPLYYLQEAPEEQTSSDLIASTFFDLNILPGLVFKSSLSTVLSSGKYFQYIPSTIGLFRRPPIEGNGSSTLRRWDNINWLFENTLTYSKSFKEHSITALAGYTSQKFKQDYVSFKGYPYPNDLIETINAAQDISEWGQDIQEWSMISYLARINYNYNEKYFLTATFRSDGSSRFGEKNRFANFPSVAGSWKVSNEDFLKENNVINNLKLRLSYGVSGNNNIGNYRHLASVFSDNYILNNNQVSASYVGLDNPYLTWEESEQLNSGLDVGFFNNRVSLTFDYYNRESKNMLLNDRIPAITGFNSQITNKGTIRNRGMEFELSGRPIEGSLNWDVNLNLSFNRNKVLALNENGDPLFSGRTWAGFSNITEVGQPVGMFYGLVWEGLYTAEEMADPNVAKYVGAHEGTNKFKDVDGNGRIDQLADSEVIGNPYPDFFFGFNNSLSYKQFDLSIIVNGQYGGEVMNLTHQDRSNLVGGYNVVKEYADRWRSADNPGIGELSGIPQESNNWNWKLNSRSVEDASYLRIANITLGYTLPINLQNRAGFIKNCRLYATVQNLATFTKYSLANPEARSFGFANNPLAPGLDNLGYPLARSITFGFNVSF